MTSGPREFILGYFSNKFMRFESTGEPLDQIEFYGHSEKFKGEMNYTFADKVQYIVYYHKFVCQNDPGIIKQIFVSDEE